MSNSPKITQEYSSPNYAERIKDIKYIILHFTEMTFNDAIERLCDRKSNVSAHYIIRNDGSIYQLVEDNLIAWHAGLSSWKGEEKLNENSIGIEMDNLGDCAFPKEQMASCKDLCLYLMDEYNIASENILGHSDIAPDRKIDPGVYFDWKYLQQNGIGIIPKNKTKKQYISSDNINIEDAQKILKNIGYKIDITGILDQQTSQVLRAFQSRFCPEVIHQKGLQYYNNLDSKYYLDDITWKTLLDFYYVCLRY